MFGAEMEGQSANSLWNGESRDLRGRIVEPHELAREIHDTVVQPLSSLLMSMTWLEHQRSPAEHLQAATGLWKALAQEALDALRATLAGLQASALDIADLPRALRSTLVPQFNLQGLLVHVQCHDWPAEVPMRVNATLFLAAREALTNIRRHAQATQAEVELRADAAELAMAITDNGVGGAPDGAQGMRQMPVGSGMGIESMRERIAQLGGEMAVRAEPGRGLRIEFWLQRASEADDPTPLRPLAFPDAGRATDRCIQ